MNKKYYFLICISFLILLAPFVSSFYPNTCDGRLSWLEDAGTTNLNFIKNYFTLPYSFANFSNGVDSWAMTSATAVGRIDVVNASFNPEGNASLRIFINWTNNSSPFRQVRRDNLHINFHNYTGFGFWFKGNSSCNVGWLTVNFLFNNSVNSAYIDYPLLSNYNFSLSDEWRYFYVDLNYVRNFSSILPLNYSEEMNTVFRGVKINIFRNTTELCNNYTTVYLDDVQIIDNDYGSLFYPRAYNRTVSYVNYRYQESVSLLAWLYSYGPPGFRGNNSILNTTLMAVDYLINNQRLEGSWPESYGDPENNDSTSTVGFTGTSLALAYIYLNNNSRLYDNVSYRQPYIKNVTGTRNNYWLLTIERSANYSIFNFPHFVSNPSGSSNFFYFNQHMAALTTLYLYYNITGKSYLLSNFSYDLSIINSTWFNHLYGFPIELNRTTNIGLSPSYTQTNLFVTSGLLYFSNNSVLSSLHNEESASLLPMVSGNQYTLKLPNGSRYTSPYSDYDNTGNSRSFNHLIYHYGDSIIKQFAYNSNLNLWNETKGYGIEVLGDSGNNEFRTTQYAVLDYLLCSQHTISSQGFSFPGNHSCKVYNFYNNSNVFDIRSDLICNTSISKRDGLDFPILIFYSDSNFSWWINNFSNLKYNTSNFIYSDLYGNLSLPIDLNIFISDLSSSYVSYNGTSLSNFDYFNVYSSTLNKTYFSNFSFNFTHRVYYFVSSCLGINNVYFNNKLLSPFDYDCSFGWLSFISTVYPGNNYLIINLPDPVPSPSEGGVFVMDLSKGINILVIILIFCSILLLMFFHKFIFAAFLLFMLGGFFLFSGINLLISFLVLAAALVVAFFK